MKSGRNWGRLGMKSNWKTCQLGDLITFQRGHDLPKTKMQGGKYPVVGSNGIIGYHNEYTTEAPSITIGRSGNVGKPFLFEGRSWSHNTSLYIKEYKAVDPIFIYYFLQTLDLGNYAGGSAVPTLNRNHIHTLNVYVSTDIDEQRRIGAVLSVIDDKIELNTAINENLEQQAQAIFKSWFGADIENLNPSNCKSLGELVTSVDNRGKTPPLSNEKTEYPIIDVRALSGSGRIINFSNCTKYVEEETYNNWFRNGHPKDYDILISTVGSLAEMKIYLGNIGCIAQNVVGFRSKGLSPIYLYQYLNYIRKELVSYNIGSVQPSIKVTHIIKHPIFIPENDKIEKFDMLIKDYTLKIYNNCCENKRLVELRDTLLPKLMNGEIDVSEVKI